MAVAWLPRLVLHKQQIALLAKQRSSKEATRGRPRPRPEPAKSQSPSSGALLSQGFATAFCRPGIHVPARRDVGVLRPLASRFKAQASIDRLPGKRRRI